MCIRDRSHAHSQHRAGGHCGQAGPQLFSIPVGSRQHTQHLSLIHIFIMGVCTWVLCFALLQLSMKAYKKRHAELENPKEDDDENE